MDSKVCNEPVSKSMHSKWVNHLHAVKQKPPVMSLAVDMQSFACLLVDPLMVLTVGRC